MIYDVLVLLSYEQIMKDNINYIFGDLCTSPLNASFIILRNIPSYANKFLH